MDRQTSALLYGGRHTVLAINHCAQPAAGSFSKAASPFGMSVNFTPRAGEHSPAKFAAHNYYLQLKSIVAGRTALPTSIKNEVSSITSGEEEIHSAVEVEVSTPTMES